MAKYAVMVVLDLDIDMLININARPEIERLTKSKVRTAIENAGKGMKVKMLRTKLLGLVEDK
jgi:hypothetical protein